MQKAHPSSASEFEFETRLVGGITRRGHQVALRVEILTQSAQLKNIDVVHTYQKLMLIDRDEGELGLCKARNRKDPIGTRWASAKGRITPAISHAHCHRTTIYDRGTIRANPTRTMDIRNSFSKLKKKVKHLGSKQKPGKTGADVDPENPLPQPESHVVADDGEGNGADGDGQLTGPIDQPPQSDKPELVPANGSENDKGGGEADIDGRRVNSMYSHLHSDVEVGAGIVPCRDGNEADGEEGGQSNSHSSPPSISRGGEPDGVSTCLF